MGVDVTEAKASPAVADDGFTVREFVVGCDQRLTTGRLGKVFHSVEDLEDTSAFLPGKATARFAIGHVYSIPVKGTTFSFGKAKWLRQYEGPETEVWQAKQKVLVLEQAAQKLEAREATDDSRLVAALEPIRKAYSRLPYPQRLPFELWVLSVLRRSK